MSSECFYTGIGSRVISEEERSIIQRVAGYLLTKGFTLRSGHALGSDEAFEVGTYDKGNTAKEIYLSNYPEIYIPWKNFKGANCPTKLISLEDTSSEFVSLAEDIVKEVHPYWHNLKQGARKLHTRNVSQVLGQDLNTPSKFLLFCSDESDKGVVSGGTATAVNLARKWNIPCFNIRNHTARELNDFLTPLIT